MDTIQVKCKLKTEVGQVADIEFSCKKEFLSVLPEGMTVEELTSKHELPDILAKFKLNEYLHNSKGAALVITFEGHSFKEYWVNGEYITDTEIQNKIEHEGKFQDKFEEILK